MSAAAAASAATECVVIVEEAEDEDGLEEESSVAVDSTSTAVGSADSEDENNSGKELSNLLISNTISTFRSWIAGHRGCWLEHTEIHTHWQNWHMLVRGTNLSIQQSTFSTSKSVLRMRLWNWAHASTGTIWWKNNTGGEARRVPNRYFRNRKKMKSLVLRTQHFFFYNILVR